MLDTPAAAPPIAEGTALLRQPTRRKLLDLIEQDPGIKISRLCERSDAGWGTVKYHLDLLRRAGLIVAHPRGRDCLLFPSNVRAEDVQAAGALRQGKAGALAQAIADRPGANQKELCERVRLTRKIIRRYVDMLSEAGLITERRDAQYQRYYPGPRLGDVLPMPSQAASEGPKGGPAVL